jgi:hypothetical protein
MPVLLSIDLQVLCPSPIIGSLRQILCLLDGLPPLCEDARDLPSGRNLSQKDIA